MKNKMKKMLLTLTAILVISIGFSGCEFSVGTGTDSQNTKVPAANEASENKNTIAAPDKAKRDAKPAVKNENRPEGMAKTAKESSVPADWVYYYDESKGYGFSMPAGTTGETETIEGIDVFGATTPAPSEIDVFVLAYKDKTLTKEDLLQDAVDFLEGLGQMVTLGEAYAESEDYTVTDAATVTPTRGKGKLRILVGTDVTDNYVMIIGTEEERFAANESIIDSIWGSFEMWSL